MEKTSGRDLTSLREYNRPPRPSRNTLVIIFHEIRYSMTRRIRYALNGIDTHLTCFCATGPTSDRPMNAIKRDAMRARTWASISICGNPRAVTYLSLSPSLSRREKRFGASLDSIYGFNLPHLRNIYFIPAGHAFRIPAHLRPHAMHILSRNTFPSSVHRWAQAEPILSLLSRSSFSQSGYAI